MKKIFLSLTASVAMFSLVSCSSDEEMEMSNEVGYISLSVSTLTSTHTRAFDASDYNPMQMAVSIVDEKGTVVRSTDDHTLWTDQDIALPVGTYTITASSNGFDGKAAGFDIPYYRGSSTVVVEKKVQKPVSIVCTLASVKVSVRFTDRFKSVFSSASVEVRSAISGVEPLVFQMTTDATPVASGYFPVGDLTAKVSVTSSKGSFSQEKKFEGVKARDHYILSYDVAESGKAEFSISADDNGNIYSYSINVSEFDKTLVDAADLNQNLAAVWATKAYLSGSVEGVENYDANYASFEYKLENEEIFTSLVAVEQGEATDGVHHFRADLTGLAPATSYSFRLVYDNGTDRFVSTERTFRTEEATALYNGNMDLWYQRPASGISRRAQWYACDEAYFKANGTWWDSSNRGTTEGAGWLANKNPTTGVSSPVHTEGGMAARLASTSAVGVFAAASLYAGTFNSLKGTSGARLDWGRPFESRPSAFKFWYQYSTAVIDILGGNTPSEAGLVKGESMDLCSAYIALMHVDEANANGTAITVDNTDMTTFPDWENDERVVAYAAMPVEDCVPTDGEWRSMNLPLTYYRTDVKPTHIIVVFAASKYGDYFTGSTKSVLLLDDLELVY